MNKMQAAARKLHAMGFKTLPIKPGTKEPATKHGVKDATDNDALTDAFYSANPNHGIGVSGEGFVIFDFDVHNGVDGRDQLIDWDLPDTLAQTTPSGGYHLIYRTDRDVKPSVNTAIAVDVRGWHSYIVCDPTPGYCWEDDTPIADANETVYAFLDYVRPQSSTTPATTGRPRKVDETPTQVREGGRNDFLYKQGCGMRADASKPDSIIRAYMIGLNNAMCVPPLDAAELNKVINSVLAHAPGQSDEVKAQRRGTRKAFNHAEIAQQLMDDYGACLIDGMPAIRRDGKYVIGWHAINRQVIELDRNATAHNQREVQHYISVMAEDRPQSPPNFIAFNNGVLDVLTMELHPYSDDFIIPNIIPCDWNPNAQCQAVDDVLLKMANGNLDTLESLIEVMGVCMYRSSEFTQSAILLGDGSNGKSTFIRMLLALLSKENVSTISMSQIGKQFLVGRMAGKLANLGSEISNEFKNGDLLSTYKELVDGNRLHADVKGVEGFDFDNYATIVLCANEFPRLADYTDGMMRRIFPIEFTARFRKSDPDYDPRIAHKVTSAAACERMAVLGVDGLKQVIAHNGFTPNDSSAARLDEIRSDNDSTLAWIEYNDMTADDFDGMATAHMYEQYKTWCDNFGNQAVSHKKFTRQINKNMGGACKKIKRNGVPINCFKIGT